MQLHKDDLPGQLFREIVHADDQFVALHADPEVAFVVVQVFGDVVTGDFHE